MVINYIGYKEHVLHTKGDLGELQLGDIVLIEESNKLDEVVVTGRQITRTTDKVLYFPSKEQLRHASDGYKALDVNDDTDIGCRSVYKKGIDYSRRNIAPHQWTGSFER